VVSDKKAKQGDRIETPAFIQEHGLKLDYSHYITNQIMKPILQLFALVIEDIWKMQKKMGMLRQYERDVVSLRAKVLEQYGGVESDEMMDKFKDKLEELRCKEVKKLLFDEYLRVTNNNKEGVRSITSFFKSNA
jgi:site-specific DNA-adenine methylase